MTDPTMYWLGIYVLVISLINLLANLGLQGDHKVSYTGGWRLMRFILWVPAVYFYWTAWQVYR